MTIYVEAATGAVIGDYDQVVRSRRGVSWLTQEEHAAAILAARGIVALVPTTPPAAGVGEVVEEGPPERHGSDWRQTWTVRPMTSDEWPKPTFEDAYILTAPAERLNAIAVILERDSLAMKQEAEARAARGVW